MAKYKVTINHDTCIACTVCYSLCPDVFESNDEGKSIIVEEFRTGYDTIGEIDDALYDCAMEAKNSCPTDSINVEEA